MASACVNNIGITSSISPDAFFPWEPEPDFEFRLQDPVTMLPADQLFSDGKLVPLHLKPTTSSSSATTSPKKINTSITTSDPILFSPKAPRCSSRWKDLLGFKKLYNNSTTTTTKTTSSSSSTSNKSFKQLLNRHNKTTSNLENGSLNLPLLKDSDNESLSISSRLSLSSSSSSHDHDDLPRLSLDSEKPNPISIHRNPNPNQNPNPNPRIRLVKPKAGSVSGSFDGNKTDNTNRVGRSPIRMESSSNTQGCRGVSVDSPRLNSSGKIVFQSLERSSSSPGSFTGGPRFKHRGMERSYSANVRVTPVLNVPVCSLRGGSKSGSVFGFGQLFSSPQKRESTNGGGGNSKNYHHHHQQQQSVRHQQQKHP
ncbi:hypothetical protein TSUD_55770 [Trifolium subterraneum]|uniref:Uncharacterized protein n=1 Tax=Trifolium subterraneum TaxID=3900 RepID=A0A2Z6MF22_TRISU|nr:hypothetical protein TSUD_55770 [Trifolium subterraneum]